MFNHSSREMNCRKSSGARKSPLPHLKWVVLSKEFLIFFHFTNKLNTSLLECTRIVFFREINHAMRALCCWKYGEIIESFLAKVFSASISRKKRDFDPFCNVHYVNFREKEQGNLKSFECYEWQYSKQYFRFSFHYFSLIRKILHSNRYRW